MDGKGCWVDNVFIERLWRSLKYENIYIKEYQCVKDARKEIGNWITYYNELRPHSTLSSPPDEEYYKTTLLQGT